MEIAHEDERARVTQQLDEVVGWLKSHKISATAAFTPSTKGDDAFQLNAEALRLGTDIVVAGAGAYGHSRIREWAFGAA